MPGIAALCPPIETRLAPGYVAASPMAADLILSHSSWIAVAYLH
jgi:hypothetical protein